MERSSSFIQGKAMKFETAMAGALSKNKQVPSDPSSNFLTSWTYKRGKNHASILLEIRFTYGLSVGRSLVQHPGPQHPQGQHPIQLHLGNLVTKVKYLTREVPVG